MRQRWHDLLFAHWPLPPDALRPLIPPSLQLDRFDGAAWLGVVPFRMSGIRPRLGLALPWLSAFPEINVRTYVLRDGKPGVWFFSLDAANPIAVRLARSIFSLPYYRARMTCLEQDGAIAVRSVRTHRGAAPAEFHARYAAIGPAIADERGSLTEWLTARYCLYAADRRGDIWRTEIDHRPWPLQPARAHIRVNTLARAAGITLPDVPPLLHVARRLDVRVWRPRRLNR